MPISVGLERLRERFDEERRPRYAVAFDRTQVDLARATKPWAIVARASVMRSAIRLAQSARGRRSRSRAPAAIGRETAVLLARRARMR